ncbi:hypothetical protein ON010_g9775 [Phytophthora cinnamomi]|nr:hypothetical protein ON010_g9775 [Phytophthora cinnamomi]
MHQQTVPYSPQQKGGAERMKHLINCSIKPERSDVTPNEVGFKVKLQLKHLRVFGSPEYAHIDDAKRTKLEPKSFRCVFLGYAENAKGYRVYDMDASKVKASRSVKLDERKVGGIYATHSQQHGTVIHVAKDGGAPTVPVETDRQPVEEKQMEAAEETVQDVRWTRMSRSRRNRFFLLGNGDENDEERKSEDGDGPPSPKRPRIDEDGLIAEAALAHAARITEATDLPETYAQAIASVEAAAWMGAMDAELLSHERNGTWTLVPRGTDKCNIGSGWVFAKKHDEIGRVIRYQAQLVAKGFKQKYGGDCFETYFPVVNMNSIRVVLAVCMADGYVMEQLDADTAFLNSDLTVRVYMEVPLGIGNGADNVCVLNKAIYGLKQAASACNKTIHRVFLKNGFKSFGADQCVYVKRSNNKIREVKDGLKNAFKMKELGTAKFILGMEIDHDETAGTLMIKQTRYIDDVVERFGQQNAKPADNPAVVRVLRYLKTTREHGIMYQRGAGNITVEAFTDADWESNIDDRRSVSGVMVRIENGPVVFKSKFQRAVALSSAEAKYMALCMCVQEVLWTHAMLKDMGKEQVDEMQMWEDNQGAIALAQNAGYHARTKHVDIRHHFIRENMERGTVKVDYIDTKHQLADVLTKEMLKYFRDASGIKAKITVQ